MGLLVQKFGGSSVADVACIRRVAARILEAQRAGNQLVVIVSAMGDTTDDLIRMAREINASPSDREMDMLITAGERKAIALVCMALADLGVEAESYTGSQAGFITDTRHTDAKILEVRPDRIEAALAAGRVPVVAGAQGVSTDNDVTFLGRGGSDTTAVALAKALKADGRISAQWVSISCNWRMMTKIGMIVTYCGIISAARKIKNNESRPRKRSREKANAAVEHVNNWIRVIAPATLKLLNTKAKKGRASRTAW